MNLRNIYYKKNPCTYFPYTSDYVSSSININNSITQNHELVNRFCDYYYPVNKTSRRRGAVQAGRARVAHRAYIHTYYH